MQTTKERMLDRRFANTIPTIVLTTLLAEPTHTTHTMTDQTCYFCESTDEIEEHHILPQRFDGSDQPTNVVELCHDCHWKLERLYNKDFWEAIGVDDPRATKETHATCNYYNCIENAVGRFDLGDGIHALRCDKHKPAALERKKHKQLRSIKDGFSTLSSAAKKFKRDLEYFLIELNNDELVSSDELIPQLDERADSYEIQETRNGFVTSFESTVYVYSIKAKFDCGWDISMTNTADHGVDLNE